MSSPKELDDSSLLLENKLCHRIYVASNLLTRIYRPLLAPLDLTYPQYLIMLCLWERDDVSILDIQDKTKIDGGSLTLILKKLVSKLFITVDSCANDKRKKKVRLSRKGKCLKKKALEVNHNLKCRLGSILEEDDYIHFVSMIEKLNTRFSEELDC